VVADKEAVHTINIIFQRQYFVARCLSSYVGNVFGLRSTDMLLFSLYPQASDVGKTHSLVPATANRICFLKKIRKVLSDSFLPLFYLPSQYHLHVMYY
jgi:hypothetical protein